MSIINYIKNYIQQNYTNAERRRCSESGCKINLIGFYEKLIIKGEEIRENPNESICDCIIFASSEEYFIGNVELKSRNINYEEIIRKFDNTSKYTEKYLNLCAEYEVEFQYYPIVLAKKWWNASYKKMFQKIKIKFKNNVFDLIPEDCGKRFIDIIAEYS